MKQKRISLALGALSAALLCFLWWAALANGSPAQPIPDIPLADMRAAVDGDDPSSLPIQLNLHLLGTKFAPAAAVEAGGGLGKTRIAYTAFEADYPDGGAVMIDAGADRATVNSNSGHASFDDAAWHRLLNKMVSARLVLLTHEHSDHVMALARNPRVTEVATHAWLTSSQRQGLLRSAENAVGRRALAGAANKPSDRVQRVAPGIAVAPMPGHSPGSQLAYVRLANGREYLFIGDIAWNMSNLAHGRTRPRFMQWFFFDPPEQRSLVIAQLHALHDLAATEPALTMVPCHDADYLMKLVREERLDLDASN